MKDLKDQTVDELLARKGELAYQGQMAALESLPLPPDVETEWRAVTEELARRER